MAGLPASGDGTGAPRGRSLTPSTAVAGPEELGYDDEAEFREQAPERRLRQKSRKRAPSGRALESSGVWALFAAIYFLIGYRTVVDLNLVNFDSLSRMAHAYFVWYNDPPKLAAIGFVWPPVQTIMYLPFVLIKPLATSLAAMPAMSAAFMAATMVVINLGFRAAQMRWFLRWPLLLAFGLNPMIVYYGANGMAEAVYLFFLTFAVYFLIRWRQTHHNHLLAFVGFGIALSMLSRYEIVPFAALLAAGLTLVILTTWGKRERARSLESGLVLYLAPVIYFGMAWLFFNWLILGDPLYFLAFGATTADVATSQQDVAGVAARDLGTTDVAVYLTKLNLALFPLTVAMVPALIVTAIMRRSPLSLVIAGAGRHERRRDRPAVPPERRSQSAAAPLQHARDAARGARRRLALLRLAPRVEARRHRRRRAEWQASRGRRVDRDLGLDPGAAARRPAHGLEHDEHLRHTSTRRTSSCGR